MATENLTQSNPPLKALRTTQLEGTETFHFDGSPTNSSANSFWRWAYSNLVANNLRGHLAEYLVACDLGLNQGTRVEWDECDLRLPTGVRIEIKSAAYLQSWGQKDFSKITFKIAPSCAWDRKTQTRSKTPARHSDIYVFCLLNHKDKESLDPKNLNQWDFFVLPTSKINEKLGNQENISLSALKRLAPAQCRFGEINRAVAEFMNAENTAHQDSQDD